MLYAPCTSKPRYGDAGIIPGHPLTPDFALLMNEGGGNAVWNLIGKGKYDFDTTYTPSWDATGVKFDANRLHINGPALNDVLPAGCTSFTIFFRVKNLSGDPSSGRFYLYCSGYAFALTIDISNINFYVNASVLLNSYDADILAGTTYCITVSGSAVALYKDGEVSAYSSSGVAIPTSTDTLEIGARNSDNRYSNAIFECFCIFQKALTDTEVLRLHHKSYCWLYSRSEQLIRSVWAVSAGGGIEITGDNEPGYTHGGLITQSLSLTGDVEPSYSHAGFVEQGLEITGDSGPVYAHAGLVEQELDIVGNIDPSYNHTGLLTQEQDIIGDIEPSYSHAGLIEQGLEITGDIVSGYPMGGYIEVSGAPVEIVGDIEPDYVHTGEVESQFYLIGDNQPGYAHNGVIEVNDGVTGDIVPDYNHSGLIEISYYATGNMQPIYVHAGLLYVASTLLDSAELQIKRMSKYNLSIDRGLYDLDIDRKSKYDIEV